MGDKFFKLDEFRDLDRAQQRLVIDLIERCTLIQRDLITPENLDDETLNEGLELYANDYDGCVPEGYEENLEQNIIRKFADFYWCALDEAVRIYEHSHPDVKLCTPVVVVEPSYEDATTWLIHDRDLGVVHLWNDCKAWHFHFGTLKDLVEALQDAVQDMLESLNKHYAKVHP
jgi:hypothetical protein